MGRGIGFQKEIGQLVSRATFEKEFILSEKIFNQKLHRLVSVLPPEHFVLSEKIIDLIKSSTNWQLSDNIYITLTDHISGAIKRYENGISIENPLKWDIKHFYPVEYMFSQKALDVIFNDCGIRFTDDEAGFIALHLVNARISTNENMELVHKMTKIIKEITNIVKYHFNMEQFPNTFEYFQFVNYLKSLAPKIIAQTLVVDETEDLFEVILSHFKKVHGCVIKIYKYMEEQYNYRCTGEEMLFVAMYISKINDKK